MLFSIGNLITLAIVLVFFFIYHKLTANNRSLEKVKRLADKLEVQLNDYVGERAEELKHYGIDLDVQQKAAKIALEKLQNAQAAVAEKAEAVGAIAERFKEYDDVLAKLMDMTARVDENLKRIHEEEVFAEGVNRKLDLAKKSITAIEREMPLLREGFAQDAQKTIDGFRDSILAELQSALGSVETELNSVRDEAMAAFEKAQSARALVDKEFEKALQSAKDRATSVEDQAFASLRASIEAKAKENADTAEAKARALNQTMDLRMSELESEAERRLIQVGQETGTQVTALKTAIESFRQEWKHEAEGMMSDISTKLSEADQIFATKAEEIAQKLEKADTSAAKTIESFVRESGEAKAVMASEAAKAKDVAELAHASSAALLASLKTKEAELKASLETTKNSIEEEFASFGQAFEDHRTRFEENFMAETKTLGARLDSLSKEIKSLKDSAFENAKGKLQGFEDGLLAELAERRGKSFRQLDGWLTDMEKTLQGIVTESTSRRKAEEDKYKDEFRAHMTSLRDELYAQMDKLRRDVIAVRDDKSSDS